MAAIFPDTPHPGLVASFGTGSAGGTRKTRARRTTANSNKRPSPAKVTKSRNKKRRRSLSDLFAFRIFQAFLSQGDSTRAWNQLLCQRAVHGGGEFFRFDVEYNGPAPSLDNVTDLDEMEQLAEECIMASPALDRLALCIRAQHFYFELDAEPEFVNGLYECVGHISCRLEPGSEEHYVFLESLDKSSSRFKIGSNSVPGGFLENSALSRDEMFSKQVKFCVHGRQIPFTIALKEGLEEACAISGSPFTVDQLIRVQQIDACFGRTDHQP